MKESTERENVKNKINDIDVAGKDSTDIVV